MVTIMASEPTWSWIKKNYPNAYKSAMGEVHELVRREIQHAFDQVGRNLQRESDAAKAELARLEQEQAARVAEATVANMPLPNIPNPGIV